MPVGPRGEKRSADLIGCEVHVARISTWEAENERYTASRRRRQSGQAGPDAPAFSVFLENQSEVSKEAVSSHWR